MISDNGLSHYCKEEEHPMELKVRVPEQAAKIKHIFNIMALHINPSRSGADITEVSG